MKQEYLDPNFDKSAALCAIIKVPASYENLEVANAEFTIQLIKDPADESVTDPENLFMNPGGPGGSGVEFIQYVQMSKEMRDKLNIIGFDPRGVKFSSEIRCDDKLDLQSYYSSDYFLDSQEEVNEAEVEYQNYHDDCIEKNPLWFLINTSNTVKDLEIIRQVVNGEKPLNFSGSSYGTTIAAEYIRLFPEKVGKFMLDSPTQNDLTKEQEAETNAKAQEEALKRLLDKCAQDKECPGNSAEEVAIKINKAIIKADNDQIVGVYGVKNHPDYNPGTYGSGYLLFDGIFQLTYYSLEEAFPEFKKGMLELEKNEYSTFEFYALIYHGYDPETMKRSNSDEILMIVSCMDRDEREFKTQAELDIFEEKIDKIAPLTALAKKQPNDFKYLPEKQGCEWSWRAFDDENIPDPPKEFAQPVNDSGKKVLIIASKGDNATPYSGAVRMAKLMKSPLITYEGTGHAVAYGTNACLSSIVDKFFISNKLPETDYSCAEEKLKEVSENIEVEETKQEVSIRSCLYYQYVNNGQQAKESFGDPLECDKTEYRLGYCTTVDKITIKTFSSRNDQQYDGKDIELFANEVWDQKIDSNASCDSSAWASSGFDVDPPYYGMEIVVKDSRKSNVPNREFYVSNDGCCGSDVYMVETKEVLVN
jgi:pimeloyl-ACP methyl ester carboxylesterase